MLYKIIEYNFWDLEENMRADDLLPESIPTFNIHIVGDFGEPTACTVGAG